MAHIKMTEKEIKTIVDESISGILDQLKNIEAYLEQNNVDKYGRFLVLQRISNAVSINCNPAIADIALENIRPRRKDQNEEWT